MDAHSGQEVGVAGVFGLEGAAAFFPCRQISGLLHRDDDIGIKRASGIGERRDGGFEAIFQNPLGIHQLPLKILRTQGCEVGMAHGMRLEIHIGGKHLLGFVPSQAIGATKIVGDHEHRRARSVLFEDREGLGEIIAIAIVERDRHRLFGERFSFAEGLLDFADEQKGESLLLKEPDLELKILWRDGEIADKWAALFLWGQLRHAVVHEHGDGELVGELGEGERGFGLFGDEHGIVLVDDRVRPPASGQD